VLEVVSLATHRMKDKMKKEKMVRTSYNQWSEREREREREREEVR